MNVKMYPFTSVLQFRFCCRVGDPYWVRVLGLGLRDRWLPLSHSLEESDPDDPELECLTRPPCVCVRRCRLDKLSINNAHDKHGIA